MSINRSIQADISRKSMVTALLAGSILLVALGVLYGVYTLVYGVSYTILGTRIPGFTLAGFAIFLGVKYFLSILILRKKM